MLFSKQSRMTACGAGANERRDYMKTKMNLPVDVKTILDRLMKSGHDAYVVGGCVRDALLRDLPHDWDICTSAVPEEVERVFADCRVIETGMKHGTVTVVLNAVPYEITTFRIDGDYSDGRHPDSVTFTDRVLDDLSRRDFTINAMAYNNEAGLVDPFGGRKDLERKTIRCVGDPLDRFGEDPLRILRAIRFRSKLGFEIEAMTTAAMYALTPKLQKISAERVREELCKTLMGKHVFDALMGHGSIFVKSGWLPELETCFNFDQNNKWHDFDVYEHIVRSIDAYKGNDPVIRLTMLFHDIGKPACYVEDEKGGHFPGHPLISSLIADRVMQRLKFDNKTRNEVVQLVREHDRIMTGATKRTVLKILNEIGEQQARRLADVRRADIIGASKKNDPERLAAVDKYVALIDEILAEKDCFTLKDLAVNGHDMMALGIQGTQIGVSLKHLLDLVIFGAVPNEKQRLLKEAESLADRAEM